MATNKFTNKTSLFARTTQDKLNEMIQRKAYELFEKRGCTPGNELGDWFEAEKLVRQELARR